MKLLCVYSWVSTSDFKQLCNSPFLSKTEKRNERQFSVQNNVFVVWPKEGSEGFSLEAFKR